MPYEPSSNSAATRQYVKNMERTLGISDQPKERWRWLTGLDGAAPYAVQRGVKRTMWWGSEIDAIRAAMRNEFTRTA